MRTMGRQLDRRSFALVVTLLLVTLLVATAAGLGTMVMVQAARGGRSLLDLQHRFAVDSFLVVMPSLISSARAEEGELGNELRTIRIGRCEARAVIRPERGKRQVATDAGVEAVGRALTEVANGAGLDATTISPAPIVDAREAGLPAFVWFGQLIRPTEFETVFRWRFAEERPGSPSEKRVWSDLVTFWDASGGVFSVELETVVDGDVRRWYVVAEVREHSARVLFRGAT